MKLGKKVMLFIAMHDCLQLVIGLRGEGCPRRLKRDANLFRVEGE